MRIAHAEIVMREHNSFDTIEQMAAFFLELYPPHQLALVTDWTNKPQQAFYLRQDFRKAAERILEKVS